MGKTATEIKSQFTIATGDNFYPSGVISEWDPLWKYSFEDIYTAFSFAMGLVSGIGQSRL